MNPEDLAAARWKPIRQVHEEIRQAEAAFAASQARLGQLRAELRQAERRDQEVLGKALVSGTPEPAGKAGGIRAELEAEEDRAEAIRLHLGSARGGIARAVQEHKGSWYRQALGDLTKANARYLAAIAELSDARDGLSSAASLLRWLACGGASSSEVANDRLSGRAGTDIANPGPPVSFSATIEELRRDAQRLAESPAELDEPAPRPAYQLIKRAVS